ncbi:MAG: transporter substrate-binding domain-containing protein [Rhizobiaceae bacterium]|nr:transporter substrate-binding domain-containing protein [Rhizobiaceae bacterium]
MRIRNQYAANLILAISLIYLTMPSISNAQTQLRIGVDGTYPPFSHRNIDGEYSGLDIDVANALCKAMKSKCEFIQFEYDNLLAALRGKKIDMVVASIPINDQRLELVDFSNPYLQLPSAVLVRKDSIISGLSADDMKNAQIGVINSSPHGEYVRTHLPDANITQYQNLTELQIDLANQRLDAIVGNGLLIYNWLQTPDGSICCKLLGTLPYDTQINGEGAAIVLRKNSAELKAKINKALKAIKTSKRLGNITRTYLPFLK